MNQILVTQKVIMTKDFKRKKRLYKFNFFFASFFAVLLLSYSIYAEYDRNKSEQVSQGILTGMINENFKDDTTISVEDDILIVKALSNGEETGTVVNVSKLTTGKNKSDIVASTAPDGKTYYTEAVLKIEKLGIEYPVLSDWSDELLKISLNKLWGPDPNEIGNYVIIGHNYNSGKMFGKLLKINIGDTFKITDISGRTVTYKVYTTYVVDPDDVSCTSQLTDGKREVTLITCTATGKQRFIVKAEAI